jgi:NTE family protein
MGATYDYIVLGAPLVGAGAGLAIRQVRALVFAPGGRLAEAARAPASAAWAAAGAAIGLVATGLPAQPTLGELQSLGGQAGFPVLRGLPVSHEAFAADPLPPLVRRAPRGPVARAIDWLARDVAGLRVGLALGAGSARGFAHIGVLKALEREGVPIDALAGTSVGAFVGAFWSCGLGAEGAADALERAGRRPFGLAVQRSALFSNRWIGASLRGVVGERRFEDLPHPFAAVAVDLVTGDPVALHRGPLWRAVLASGTIPGVYPPVADEGRLLVDGVVRMPVPTGVAADLGGDVTIGVRLAPRREDAVASAGTPGPEQRNIVGVVLTILDVMQEAIEAHGTARADLLIHPEVTKVTLRHFAEGRALVAAGEVAAEEALPALRRLLPWLGDACPE